MRRAPYAVYALGAEPGRRSDRQLGPHCVGGRSQVFSARPVSSLRAHEPSSATSLLDLRPLFRYTASSLTYRLSFAAQ